jgi:spore germination protein KB
MIKEGKFGVQEAVWLTTIAISAKVFFSSPAMLTGIVGNSGWYMTIISAAIALVGFLFIYLLLKRFPKKDIVEIFDLSLGRIFGFIFSGILALYMLFVAITRLSEFNEVLRVYVFPLSPNWYIIGIFIVSVSIMSWLGLESIARFSKLLVYIMLAGFILVLAMGTQNFNINNLYPVLGHGLDKTITTGIVRSSVYGEVIILAIFAKTFQGVKYIKKEGIISICLSALLISLSLLAFTLTFPYYTAKEITAPMYELATLIDYGRFVQRVEPIFLFIWIISSLISTTIVFYSFVWIFCKMFRIQDKKPVILGASVIVYAAALMHKDIISVISVNVQFMRNYGSIVFILPLLALIIAAIRRKGVKHDA